MHHRPDVDYIYDGSMPGLLTCIFTAYERRQNPVCITVESGYQLAFGRPAVEVGTDREKADRVHRSIKTKLGSESAHDVETVFLCDVPDREALIYRYIRYGLQNGKGFWNHLTQPDVAMVEKLCKRFGAETHAYQEFIRFAELETGVYYAKFSPEHLQVPRLMPHFADRFNIHTFMLHDLAHNMAGIYDGEGVRVVTFEALELPELSEEEEGYQQMWVDFYHTIAVEGRINPKLRQQHLPKKYWRHMTEFIYQAEQRTPGKKAQHQRKRESGSKALKAVEYPLFQPKLPAKRPE